MVCKKDFHPCGGMEVVLILLCEKIKPWGVLLLLQVYVRRVQRR